MATYNKRYTASEDVKKKEQAYRDQLAAAPSYTSQYQQQLDSLRGDIMGRDTFKYDVNADALYQQLRDQYQQQGKLAMMDTMGQAAGLTGGYGSSYGQNVGQQAYQGYLRELNNQIPDLYGMALDRYIAEGDAMLQNYGLMLDAEAEDYGRWQDQYSMWQNEANRLYGEYQNAADADYNRFRDEIADDMWQTEYDETLRQYNLAMGLNADGTPVASSSGGSSGGGSSSGSGGGAGADNDNNTTDLTYDRELSYNEWQEARNAYLSGDKDVPYAIARYSSYPEYAAAYTRAAYSKKYGSKK